MRNLPLLRSPLLAVAACASVLAVVACGNIVDPSRSEGDVATIRGALSGGSAPSNARVALVWRTGAARGWAAGDDVAITNGSFTMSLTAPSASYSFEADDVSFGGTAYDDAPNVEGHAPDPADAGAPPADIPDAAVEDLFAPKKSPATASPSLLSPRDQAGGSIGKPLLIAAAGFVVYVDKNGNGKLDIGGDNAASTDEVIGGNSQLLLTYFRDGGSLDYEEMRDETNTLPHAGFNLLWTKKERWLPLTSVDLELDAKERLPSAVCGLDTTGPAASPAYPEESTTEGGNGNTHAPVPPSTVCSPDGRSYTVESSCNDTPSTEGLCGSDGSDCTPSGFAESLADGEPVPAWWPCPAAAADAGAP